MKKITSKLGLLALAGTLALTSCSKKEYVYADTQENSTQNDNSSDLTAVYDRTVNYSILVTAQGESAFRSTEGVEGAAVAISVDGGVVETVTTGADGIATFGGLKPGAVTASITKAGWATVNLVVDLNDGLSSPDIDNHSERSAATLVTMLPVTGLGTSTLRGELEIENNQNNTDPESMPTGLATLTARVNFNDFDDFNGNNGLYAHSGYGDVTQVYVEGLRGIANFSIEGSDYSITLPATAYGLPVEVYANRFNYTNTDSGSNISTETFSIGGTGNPETVWAGDSHTGMTYVVNLSYNR